MFGILKDRWKRWREKRFLEKHGCSNRREYELKYDTDVGYKARWAHTFYHGYPYILPIKPDGLRDYGLYILPYHDQSAQMMEWCEKNCKGKWRNDWARGFYDQHGNFELGYHGVGTDMLFFAFKEESDYTWFALAWS